MATFVSTTLTKRTGATTTVFSPLGVDNGIATLADVTASNQRIGDNITFSSKRTGNNKRITRVRVSAPVVDTTGAVPVLTGVCVADISLTVPDGVPTARVNDLVGYVEKVFASATTNFNDLLVKGEGVW